MSSWELEFHDNKASEAELEDWAARYMARYIHPHAELMGRQVTLPSGRRLDLLFSHVEGHLRRLVLTVVEMKAGSTGVGAVIQCLKYVEELRKSGWDNVKVRGVVAAESFDPETHLLVRNMAGVALMTLSVYLKVTCDPLYDLVDDEYQGWPVQAPDVDRTRARSSPMLSSLDQRRRIQELIRDGIVAGVADRDRRAGEARRHALVPLHLTPSHVAYRSNGKGHG